METKSIKVKEFKTRTVQVIIENEDDLSTYEGNDEEEVATKIAANNQDISNKLFDILGFSADITHEQFDKIKSRDFVAFMDELEDLVKDWQSIKSAYKRIIEEQIKEFNEPVKKSGVSFEF
jgi:phosphoribosylaminoimidazole-succinocarboxamide synthase